MNEDTILGVATLSYIVGIPIALGVMISKLGAASAVAAVFLAVIWPVTALTYLGYWLAS